MQPTDKSSKATWAPVLAAALGLLWFVVVGAGSVISPTNTAWIFDGDLIEHYLGWSFFRLSAWSFPLGHISGFIHPIGTSVGLTDSIPWVAVALKPFSSLLPVHFQYIGMWMALSFVLQGVVAEWLLRPWIARTAQRLLAVSLFVLAPVLVHRITGHDSLTSHWLILAMIGVCLRPATAPGALRTCLAITVGINVLGAGIHPYLEAMVVALSVALVFRWWRFDRLISWQRAASLIAAVLALDGLLLVLFGYVGQPHALREGGFGAFSSDLLTFVNPVGWSRVVPDLPLHSIAQWEGFAYLGLGNIAVALMAVVLWRRRGSETTERFPAVGPLLATCLLMAAFALSSQVTFAGRPVLNLSFLYEPLGGFTGPFRSSGRFIWPLFYLIVAASTVTVVRHTSRAVGTAVLSFAVILQLGEAKPRAAAAFQARGGTRLSAPEWQLARRDYQHLVLYPPRIIESACSYAPDYALGDYAAFALKAYELGLTVNSGRAARRDPAASARYCAQLKSQVDGGVFDTQSIYVVDDANRDLFERHASLRCGSLDQLRVCVASARPTAFEAALAGGAR